MQIRSGRRDRKFLIWAVAVALSALALIPLSNCGGGSSPITTATLAITTASLPNGTSEMPYSQSIQATGGTGPFAWSISGGSLPHNLSLSTSSTSSATISGTPDTAAQGVAFTVKVTDASNQTATRAYVVSILLEPDTLTLSPPNLSFGSQPTATTSVAQTETLTNTGSLAVAITGIAIAGNNAPDFAETTTCGSSLAAGAACTISVSFTPAQIGPSSAAITITDSTLGSPHSVPLDGIGTTTGPNATLSSATVVFGSQLVGTTSSPQSITLSNYGTAAVNVTGVSVTAQFGETDNCVGSLAPAASCTINLTFTPAASGTASGTLSVTDNAPGSPQTAALSGTGFTAVHGFCSITSFNTLTGNCVVPNPGLPIGRCSSFVDNTACHPGAVAGGRRQAACTNLPAIVDPTRPCP